MDRFKRPPMRVLPDKALVPDKNMVSSPPTAFTHRVMNKQPFYYDEPQPGQAPDGELAGGTAVSVVADCATADLCRVVDKRGLSVVTPRDGLQKIEPNPK